MVENTTMGMVDGNNPIEHQHHQETVLNNHYHSAVDSGMPVINSVGGVGGGGGAEPEACSCAGCGGKIVDRYYLLAVEKPWHVNCLKCADCQLSLDSELTCFAKDGHIYCKDDYYRRFAIKRCARCQIGISANDLVMRARELVYHIGCFTCASCNKALTTGDYFGMKEDMIYCRSHYELLLQGDFMQPGGGDPGVGGAALPAGPHTQIPFYNGVGTTQKGRPRKRKSPMPDQDPCLGMDSMGPMVDGFQHGQPPRQKRVRTSFKHHQLRTMKSYFALNHNPDAKDLKQLAQKTGLSKRVLQVWFQNARAKYRRNILKQQSDASPRDVKNPDGSSKTSDSLASDMSHGSRSPALSDISSSPSLSDLQNSSMECESMDARHMEHSHPHHMEPNNNDSTGTSLTELFSVSNTLASMN